MVRQASWWWAGVSALISTSAFLVPAQAGATYFLENYDAVPDVEPRRLPEDFEWPGKRETRIELSKIEEQYVCLSEQAFEAAENFEEAISSSLVLSMSKSNAKFSAGRWNLTLEINRDHQNLVVMNRDTWWSNRDGELHGYGRSRPGEPLAETQGLTVERAFFDREDGDLWFLTISTWDPSDSFDDARNLEMQYFSCSALR